MVSTRYRTVFLDAGGVLVCPDWTRAAAALASHGVPVAAATLEAAEPFVKRQLDVAPTVRITNDEQRGFLYFDLILKRAGITANADTDAALAELKVFHDQDNTWDSIPDGVVPALQRLRAAKLQIVVVSNSNGTLRRLFDRVGLARHMDVIIDSKEEGVEKPDPRLFHRALQRAGADPAATIHCGDLYEIDVIGARTAGLPAVLLDAAEMYEGVDCPRVRSLGEFADRLISGAFD
ncbi:MAG: HAD family hydrolase [Acidobacteriota bacterium]